eukprot:5111225-Pleurochrysis_carterae.AAC.1
MICSMIAGPHSSSRLPVLLSLPLLTATSGPAAFLGLSASDGAVDASLLLASAPAYLTATQW